MDIGAYEYGPPAGSIVVRIDPIYAVDAGAKWSLDGINWNASQFQMDYVPVGIRTITFTNIPGLMPPSNLIVAVAPGAVTATNATYLPSSPDTDGDGIPDECRGRDTGCPVPPSQIPACDLPAPGSSS